MNQVAQAIAATEARSVIKAEDSLENRFRAALKVTKGHWMATDKEDQLKAAIAAVYATASEDEKTRIMAEVNQLKVLSAALSGVPVDFAAITPMGSPIGIMSLWHEIEGA